MINHGQKGIFTPIRNQQLTGRNANIQPTMFKRKQIFEKSTSERNETPFSGYSFTGSSVTDNSLLARSQVSDFSQQNVIKLIQQQLQKNGLNTLSQTSQQSLKNKNQLNILRIQIRSIKQSYHELNKSFKKKIQQQNDTINDLRKQINGQNKDQSISRQQLSGQLVNKIKQVQQDIAMKMRMIFGKMQEDLRKQLTNYANRQFVPTSFLDDLDKQLNELDDRIANIQNQYQSNKNNSNKQNISVSKIDKDSSMILSSNSQLKLNKFQRDLQYVKKILDEKSQKIKQIDELISMDHEKQLRQLKQIKQNISEFSAFTRQSKKDNQNFKQKIQNKLESYKKSLLARIQQDVQNLNKKIQNEHLLLSQRFSNNQGLSFKKTQSTSILVANNQQMSESIKLQETRQQSKIYLNDSKKQIGQSKKQIVQSPSKKSKKITITYGNAQKSPTQALSDQIVDDKRELQVLSKKQIEQKNQQQKQNKVEIEAKKMYKIDKQGYLMDSQNKYILTASNSMIRVSQQQIMAMQKTNLIKVQRWNSIKQLIA